MAVKGGRVDFLAPHLLRSQLLRPGFVRLTLRLGIARHMPPWARLQFTNGGVSARDLDRVLGRVTSLASWVDEWERLAREHEQLASDALEHGHRETAARHFLSASAAYNFAQYVVFLDIRRKRALHVFHRLCSVLRSEFLSRILHPRLQVQQAVQVALERGLYG